MIKYIKQPDNSYTAIDTASDFYLKLNALAEARRPVFLDESDDGVQAYLASLVAANNVKVISARQGREWLIEHDLISIVQPAIDAIQPAKQQAKVQNYWEYSTQFELEHPVLQSLASALGFTPVQLQVMFNEASQL